MSSSKVSVEFAGPPPVNRRGSVNSCDVAMSCRISVTNRTLRSDGSVMWRIFCQIDAPSTSAASYSYGGTLSRAAR